MKWKVTNSQVIKWRYKFSLFAVLPRLIPLTTGMDLFSRHGAILAVAEITHALAKEAEDKNK